MPYLSRDDIEKIAEHIICQYKSGQIKCFMIGHCYRIPKINILEFMGIMDGSNS